MPPGQSQRGSVLRLMLSCFVLKFIVIFEPETHIFFLQQTLQIPLLVLATGRGDKGLLKRQVEG